MKRADFLKLKADLLCYGMKIEEDAKAHLEKEYPHFFEKGFIHATNISIYGSNMCVGTADAFSAYSKYTLYRDENSKSYRISGSGNDVEVKFFGPMPNTGLSLDGMAQLHSPTCINVWPSSACCYDSEGNKCKFCSIKKKDTEPIDSDLVAEYIKRLLAELGRNAQPKDGYVINLSGGTYKNPDRMMDYYIELVKKIRNFSNCRIAIEFAPPSNLDKISELAASGCDAGIINLEIANDKLRKELCPGKGLISYEHYYDSFRKAVEAFGYGMVSSVLIGGIQPKEDIVNECAKMAEIGVFPTIIPFKPFDNCELVGFKPCDSDELIEMSEKLGAILRKHNLSPMSQPGCTECGGCSIENDCFDLSPTLV